MSRNMFQHDELYQAPPHAGTPPHLSHTNVEEVMQQDNDPEQAAKTTMFYSTEFNMSK